MQRPKWWTFQVEGDSETQVRFRCGTATIARNRADIMGAAEFRRPGGYAWIEHDWSRKHCKMRYFVYARG